MFSASSADVRRPGLVTTGAVLGILAAAAAVIPGTAIKIALLAPFAIALPALWTLAKPERWLWMLFGGLILLPPIPAPVGDTGAHLAPLIALLGGVAGIVRLRGWRGYRGTLPVLLVLFTAIILGSAGLAMLYSGAAVGAQSFVRGCLFAIAPYVFLYTAFGPRDVRPATWKPLKILFWVGVAGAVFGCVDFYYQLPAPAGFEQQFVWLEGGVFRRAQGLFYEASTFGNFCAFFLVMILVALFRRERGRPLHRAVLLLAAVVFSAGLIFSYSRGSLVNLLIAATALLFVERLPFRRVLGPALLAVAVTGLLVWIAAPTFLSHYWNRVAASLEFFQSAPNLVLSGRLETWRAVFDFLRMHPLDAVFGIGYKTLPYSTLASAGIVADNTYLSLLIETGVVGLGAFLLLNAAIVRTAWRAARSSDIRNSFYGSWIFCFWLGELAQMLSGDLITYWRVLPVYFWVLGMAARETAE